MRMPPITVFLNQLSEADLFTSMGKRIEDPRVETLDSIEAAMVCCQGFQSHYFRGQRHEDLCREIPDEDSQLWYAVSEIIFPPGMELGPCGALDEIVARIRPALARKLDVVGSAPDHARVILDTAVWDLSHAGLELEFAEVLNFRFHRDLSRWYLSGHIVCGWTFRQGSCQPLVY